MIQRTMKMQQSLFGTDSDNARDPSCAGFRVAGLFAGIGGIELGLTRVGYKTVLLCELEDTGRAVLSDKFQDPDDPFPMYADVRDIEELPDCDLLSAGFPCQDLSQAGRTAGITGEKSGLVGEVFRLMEGAKSPPTWLMLENVPFMLSLDKGKAMKTLVDWLDEAGFNWAYRVVDTRCFGIPQRRRRVILLASLTEDPKNVLFADNVETLELPESGDAYGFYWTEGRTGLGWAVESVPTLKGGSTIGIPSPPAIWKPSESVIVKPDIRDAERLQGFPEDWTKVAEVVKGGARQRWKLVGNAVSVPVAQWVGERLIRPGLYDASGDKPKESKARWPMAAWGEQGNTFVADNISEWPVDTELELLSDFLNYPGDKLSWRASAGFYKRATSSTLRFKEGFLEAVKAHRDAMEV